MIRTLTILTLVSLVGTIAVQAMEPVHTLAANDTIANQLIETQVDESTARALLETPYRGFYQLNSKVNGGRMTFDRVVSKQSFPDARWKDMATDIASLVEIPAYSTGSRIKPKATAYVVFYDNDVSGVDRSKVMRLPTTTDADPNMMVLLVIKHQNLSRTQAVKGTQTESASQNGNSIYFFELAM